MKLLKVTGVILAGITIIGIGTYMLTFNINDGSKTIKQDTEQIIEKEKPKVAADYIENIKLSDINGQEVNIKDYLGKRVYVNFWAPWSDYCKEELEDIEKLYQETKDTDIEIITVVLDGEEKSIESIIVDRGYNFKVLVEKDSSVAKLYEIEDIPSSYFLNKDGQLVKKRIGTISIEDMRQELEELSKTIL